MDMGSMISTGIGALGGAFGGGGGTDSIHPSDYIARWAQPGWQELGMGVLDLNTPEYFQGNTVAGLNPWINQGLGGMANFGSGMGGDIMNAQFGAGMGGFDAMGGGMDYLSSLQQAGPNQFQFDQGAFDTVMGNLMPGMQGQYDNAARDIQQNFDWNQLPGLDMASAMSGGGGNTKIGQASALGQAMANQQKADFAQGLYTNALNQANAAGMEGGLQNLSSANQFGQDVLTGYGRMASLGLPMLQSAYGTGVNNFANQMQAGEYQRGYDQELINADMDRWNFNQQAPWTAMQNRINMFMPVASPGAPSPGVQGMSPWEGAIQGGIAGMGMYNYGQGNGWWGGTGGSAGSTMDPYNDGFTSNAASWWG